MSHFKLPSLCFTETRIYPTFLLSLIFSFACGDPLPSIPTDSGTSSESDMLITSEDDAMMNEDDMNIVDQGTEDMEAEAAGAFCQSCDEEACPDGYECFHHRGTGEHFCSTTCSETSDCPSGYICGVTTADSGSNSEAGSEAGTEVTEAGTEMEVSPMFCIPEEDRCEPKLCRDEDGDGYGRGPDCLGLDCADDDPNRHEGISEDLCDNVDNDCDGLTDESFVPESCGQGVCVGMSICENGRISCDGPSASGEDANCNLIDEDCDGSIDEGYQPISCGLGACVQQSSCINGEEQCTGSTPPANDRDQLCDRIDSDCDGVIDEGYPETSSTCGQGVCAVRGSCTEQGEVCMPINPSTDEDRCDGLDNDCDGSVDEDFVSTQNCGLGACFSPSVCREPLEPCENMSCPSRVELCIEGEPALTDETCDNIDDDCNGVIDDQCAENYSQLGFTLVENTAEEIEIAVILTTNETEPVNALVLPTLINIRFTYPTSIELLTTRPGQALIDTYILSNGSSDDILLIHNPFTPQGTIRFTVPNPQPLGLEYVRAGELMRIRFTKTPQAVGALSFQWAREGTNPTAMSNGPCIWYPEGTTPPESNHTCVLPVILNNAEF